MSVVVGLLVFLLFEVYVVTHVVAETLAGLGVVDVDLDIAFAVVVLSVLLVLVSSLLLEVGGEFCDFPPENQRHEEHYDEQCEYCVEYN